MRRGGLGVGWVFFRALTHPRPLQGGEQSSVTKVIQVAVIVAQLLESNY